MKFSWPAGFFLSEKVRKLALQSLTGNVTRSRAQTPGAGSRSASRSLETFSSFS